MENCTAGQVLTWKGSASVDLHRLDTLAKVRNEGLSLGPPDLGWQEDIHSSSDATTQMSADSYGVGCGLHSGEQACGGEKGKKQKQKGPCAVERGRTEAVKVVRSRLGWEACRPSAQAATEGYVCSPTTARVCVAFHGPCCHQRSLACPMSGAATSDHVGVQEPCRRWSHADLGFLYCDLRPCCCPGLSCC